MDFDSVELAASVSPENLLMIDEAIASLAADDPVTAQIVTLRYFGGLSIDDAARAICISARTAYRHWAYARAWLCSELVDGK